MTKLLSERLKKVKLIYSDIDGTIVDNHHSLSPRTTKVFSELVQRGYLFGLISGRPPYLADFELRNLPVNMAYIGCNGNWIFDLNKNVTTFLQPVSNEFVKIFIDKLINIGSSFLLYSKTKIYRYFGNSEYARERLEARFPMLKKATVPIVEWSGNLDCDQFMHFTVYITSKNFSIPQELIELSKQYSVQIIRGSDHCFDVCFATNSKGLGLQRVLKDTNLKLENVLVFGDSYNDLSMFKLAGVSVVMKQADEDVKKHATVVTNLDNHHDGVADYLENVFFKTVG